MRDGHLKQIETLFDGGARAILPLLDTEARGAPMLRKTASLPFG
jgi:hypothetical protein